MIQNKNNEGRDCIIIILFMIIFVVVIYFSSKINGSIQQSINNNTIIKIDSNDRVKYKEKSDSVKVLYDSIYSVIDRPIGDSERTDLARRIYEDIIRLRREVRKIEDSAQTNTNQP